MANRRHVFLALWPRKRRNTLDNQKQNSLWQVTLKRWFGRSHLGVVKNSRINCFLKFFNSLIASSISFLRSLVPRERILILFRPKKPRFLDCKLAAPLSFCRGFGPRFCVHWAQNEARTCFGFPCWGFLGSGYHSDGNRQKEMQSQCRLDWALLTSGEKELNHRKARAYKTICVFDRSRCDCLILDRAWRVWSGCEVKCFCYITGKAIIYSVHGYNFESPKHWDELRTFAPKTSHTQILLKLWLHVENDKTWLKT